MRGFQNGMFQQGIFPNSAIGGQQGQSPGDAGFLGSKFHQRGRTLLNADWDFPPFPEGVAGWPSSNVFVAYIWLDRDANPFSPYLTGEYCAIELPNGFTQIDDLLYDDNGGLSGSEALGNVFRLTDDWKFVSALEFYGNAVDPADLALAPNFKVAVAKWGSNSFWMRTAWPKLAGTYRNSTCGFFSSFTFLDHANPPHFVQGRLGGTLNFIVAAVDSSGFVDITPANPFTSSPATDRVAMPQFNTRALLGSAVPWYPTIICSGCNDPGLVGSGRPAPGTFGNFLKLASGMQAIWFNHP